MYKDVWRGDAKEWNRLKLDEIANYQQNVANNFNVFSSVQTFQNPVKTKGEPFIMPIMFDLDSKDPNESLTDVRKLLDFFTKELDIQPSDIKLYFSGNKGFHLLISMQAVGIEPRSDNHKIQKHLAGYLIHRLETKTIDLAVYTERRMLRRPNSLHEKTNLHKIPLTMQEVYSLTIDEIKELAKTPRSIPEQQPAPRQKATAFYQDKLNEYLELQAMAPKRPEKTDYHFDKERNPACVDDLLQNGWKRSDGRNAATVQLACYFKQAGFTYEEAVEILTEWVTKHTTAGSQYQVGQRVANTKSVVTAIYSNDNSYVFSCAFIRSLHGDKVPGSQDYDRVKCSGNLCHCLSAEEQETPIELCLDETGNAEYTGRLVKTRVMVVGVKATPFIVPKDIEYHCWGHGNCKKQHCLLYDIPSHIGYKNLGVYSRELLQMVGVDDDSVTRILNTISGIPSCPKHNTEITAKVNVLELAVIPKADETVDSANKYVLRKIYLVRDSDNEVKVSENRYYEITGYVYPHPKNQESTIMVKDAKPLQDMVETFALTDAVKDQLKVFQCEPEGEAISAKLETLLTDISYNITQIVGRNDTALGVLLVQHSLLRLQVPWDVNPIRGWLELIVLGDTGTGKSAMIDKLVKFSGLGDTVNAESTSRTGLSYKMEQASGGGAWYIVWGAFPRADKGFLWIDECTGISKDEYGQLTMARSDGRLQVKKAVTSETNCRVRAVVSGNVVKGKRIDDFTFGCKAIKDIFNNEDIRRFDFAMGLKASDVDAEEYNKLLGTYPRTLTAEAYRNNILFAWSRTAEQVVWGQNAVESILYSATLLSKRYGRVTDVPLVSPSDMRAKLARLSAALAAVLHSVDETGEKIVVHEAHVLYILEYLDRIYMSDGLGLAKYSAVSQGEAKLSDKKFDSITAKMKALPTLQGEKAFKEFIKLFAKQDYFRVGEVENMLSIDKEEAKAIINMLSKNDLIKATSGGMKKEPRFNQYISKCYDRGILAYLTDDEDEEEDD